MALAERRRLVEPTSLERVPPAWRALGLLLMVMPALAGDVVPFQLFGWTFIMGMIGLSLMFRAGYGGMVSLIQMTVAGMGGYMVAILDTSGVEQISLGLPWWLTIPAAVLIATVFGTIVGALAVRTEGIHTIMITLAIAAAFFAFARQNDGIFNGHSGFSRVVPPDLFGLDRRAPVPFDDLTLGCAALGFLAVLHVARSPFGLALQGLRDNARRMAALGFIVTAHRILDHVLASVIAALGGILMVRQNARTAPGTAGIPMVIDVPVIAVAGGPRHPIGAFICVLLQSFTPDVLAACGQSGERYKLLIGLGFLAVVFFSPDGVPGLRARFRARQRRDPLTGGRR